MPDTQHSHVHVAASTADARMVLSRPLGPRTLSLSGGAGRDEFVPAVGGASAFVRMAEGEATVFLHDAAGKERRQVLAPGEPKSLAGLTWLLTRDGAVESAPSQTQLTENGNYGP